MPGDVGSSGAMDRYYGGERRDAALFAALGGANLVAAAILLVVAPGQRFLTFALLSIGLIEIGRESGAPEEVIASPIVQEAYLGVARA